MPETCPECLKPCELHSLTFCRTCHTHPGECGLGGCGKPATHKLTHPMEVRFFCTKHATGPAFQFARTGFEVSSLLEPFCACGRVVSQCDGSRRGCGKGR